MPPKLIFLHIPKCAGTELRRFFQSRWSLCILSIFDCPSRSSPQDARLECKCNYNKKKLAKPNVIGYNIHHPLPVNFNANLYTLISTIRNPFAWYVSLYHYHQQRKKMVLNLTFEPFIRKHCGLYSHHFRYIIGQYVDKVHFLRVENLKQDLRTLNKRLKLGLFIKNLKKTNTTVHRPYQEYYTPETQALICEADADIFERFNYSLEFTTSTNNIQNV